jgi:hypothetical protein
MPRPPNDTTGKYSSGLDAYNAKAALLRKVDMYGHITANRKSASGLNSLEKRDRNFSKTFSKLSVVNEAPS